MLHSRIYKQLLNLPKELKLAQHDSAAIYCKTLNEIHVPLHKSAISLIPLNSVHLSTAVTKFLFAKSDALLLSNLFNWNTFLKKTDISPAVPRRGLHLDVPKTGKKLGKMLSASPRPQKAGSAKGGSTFGEVLKSSAPSPKSGK